MKMRPRGEAFYAVPEELVSAVDEVDDHFRSTLDAAAGPSKAVIAELDSVNYVQSNFRNRRVGGIVEGFKEVYVKCLDLSPILNWTKDVRPANTSATISP
jgi:hypothetical protein